MYYTGLMQCYAITVIFSTQNVEKGTQCFLFKIHYLQYSF